MAEFKDIEIIDLDDSLSKLKWSSKHINSFYFKLSREPDICWRNIFNSRTGGSGCQGRARQAAEIRRFDCRLVFGPGLIWPLFWLLLGRLRGAGRRFRAWRRRSPRPCRRWSRYRARDGLFKVAA